MSIEVVSFSENAILALMGLFIIKHLICDFFLQFEYQWKNKGTFGHPGGIIHSLIHILGTFVAITFWLHMYNLYLNPNIISAIFGLEFVSHYLTDWAKVNINKYFNWGPTTSPNFWYLLGVDQTIHFGTYLYMMYLILYFI